MSGIRINQLPFSGDPAPNDFLPIHDESEDREKKITVGSITQAVESEIVDRIVKVRVESEGTILNPTGSSTVNFTGAGVEATVDPVDSNIANVTIRDKVVTNLLYVTEDGDDSRDGLTLDNAKRTIGSALREGGRFYEYQDVAQAPTYPDQPGLQTAVQRHYNMLKDAGNLIGRNKDFIVEEAWLHTLTQTANPDFVNFPEKGKRDLGIMLSSIVGDLKNGGNLSTVRAAQAFFNAAETLDYIDNILSETRTAIDFLQDLMIACMRNWEFNFVANTTSGSTTVTVVTELGSYGFVPGMTLTGGPFGSPVTIVSVNRTNSTVEINNPAGSTVSGSTVNAEYPAGGNFNSGLFRYTDPGVISDSDHLSSNLSQCSSVAHAIYNFFSILNAIFDNGKDFVTISLPPEGYTVFVKAGVYREQNPLEISANSSVIGDNLRIVTVYPENDTEDLFHVNNGSYIAGMSFRSDSDFNQSIVTFPTSGAGVIFESPYIQNCTNFAPGSTGMKVDGSRSLGLRSMVLDAFTQFNPGGIGCHVTDLGYTQLVSMFTICSDKSVLAESGGNVSLTNSNSDFGNFGLFSVGKSPLIVSYGAFENYETNSFEFLIRGDDIENFPPYLGLVAEPVETYYVVSEVRVDNPGTGYSEAPTITLPSPLGRNGITAEISATVLAGIVSETDIISEGGQYTDTQVEDFLDSRTGVTRKILSPGSISVSSGDLSITVFMEPVFYTVKEVQPIAGLNPPTYRVVFEENIPFPINDGEGIKFYQPSNIVSSSHTFEFIGGGTNILEAVPSAGATFKAENESVFINGGRVAVTSSDQGGNFRIGDGIFINNARGQIEGEDFERSLFSILSPFIIALGD